MMKCMSIAATVLVAGFVVASANAALIFSDSFENPAVTGLTNTNPTGWTELGGNTSGGINDEDSGKFTTPFGSQVLWANGTNQFITTSSILSAVLTANTDYTLTFYVAKRSDVSGGNYKVELLAGSTVLNTVTGTTPNNTTFANQVTLLFSPDAGHAGLLGQTLAIRVGTNGSYQPQFDNFELDATLVPEPASLVLLGIGGALLCGRRRS